jgi:hypothetical protein
MSESSPMVRRARYLEVAARLNAMARDFGDAEDGFGNGVVAADQLRALAADARIEAEVLRHPMSRAWAVLTWCGDDVVAYERALNSSRDLYEPGDNDLIETTQRRYAVAVDDPFRPKLVERLREAARGL